MKAKFKFLFRRTLEFLNYRLKIRQRMLQANEKKLVEAEVVRHELVDIMPGINMPMVIHPEMYFSRAYTKGIFEHSCLYYIRDTLHSGQTVLDVGANVGYFSLFFAKKVGPYGRVIALEPGEFAYNLLQRNRELNKLDWLKIHQIGLGEETTIATFNYGEPGMDVFSSLGEICHHAADPQRFHKAEIQLFRGDTWMRNNKLEHIDFMKLDVEGGEYSVLKGMIEMFREQKISRLLIEMTFEMSAAFNYSPSNIISLLRSFGYDWFILQPFGRLKRAPGNEITEEGMFVAVLKNTNN